MRPNKFLRYLLLKGLTREKSGGEMLANSNCLVGTAILCVATRCLLAVVVGWQMKMTTDT
ncbi:hypothetical protein EJ08DRAFT_650410 [Tothia fuscella]|uniref:Uncharacterized protein n=1 Tax=Tothia fuscella TaxID=1048955 RepID=A0A9P4TWL3_9PEZI|nr:hypothetical protein EJ08DRAFT_650410 [Tothia fuscella]